MSDLNHLILFGHVTKNAAMKIVNGKPLVEFSIANNYVVKNDKEEYVDMVNFFFITLWGPTAQKLLPYLVKGLALNVEGSLRQDRFADKDGKMRSRLRIVAQRLYFAGPMPKGAKKNASDGGPQEGADAGALAGAALDVGGEAAEYSGDVVDGNGIPVDYSGLPDEDDTELRD